MSPNKSVGDFPRKIAKITRAELGFEDHGIFSVALQFDYGGSVQGMGPWGLGKHGEFGGIIRDIITAAGVSDWSELVGRTVYVLTQDDSWSSPIVGFENLPTEKGKRIVFRETFEALRAAGVEVS